MGEQMSLEGDGLMGDIFFALMTNLAPNKPPALFFLEVVFGETGTSMQLLVVTVAATSLTLSRGSFRKGAGDSFCKLENDLPVAPALVAVAGFFSRDETLLLLSQTPPWTG